MAQLAIWEQATGTFVTEGSSSLNPVMSPTRPMLFDNSKTADAYIAQMGSADATANAKRLARSVRVVYIGYVIAMDRRGTRWLSSAAQQGRPPIWTQNTDHRRKTFDTLESAVEFKRGHPLTDEGLVRLIARI